MTDLQRANAAYVHIDTGPRVDWRDAAKEDRADAEIVLERFFIYAHGGQSWADLSTSWRPFIQTGPRERKFWSLRRLAKAVDALVEFGAIEDVDGKDCNWRLTAATKQARDLGARPL